MTTISCLNRADGTFDATKFCDLFSQAILADLKQHIPADELLEQLKQRMDQLDVKSPTMQLPEIRYAGIDRCWVPLSVAVNTFHEFLADTVEPFGVETTEDIEADHSKWPYILSLQGEMSVDMLSVMIQVEKEDRTIGGVSPFRAALEGADNIPEVEKKRMLNQLDTGSHLMVVSKD